jgi:diketogulonate reductase-like aldo/keto reductase
MGDTETKLLAFVRRGVFMPKISLGTCCGSDPKVGLEPWLEACGSDVCGIDTAWDYKDQPAIGAILKAKKTPRTSVFITTKVPPSTVLCDESKGAAATLANIQLDVKQLEVEYVDLLLLHGPCKSAAQINAMWSGAEEALKAGIVKSIGVSNFNAAQLAEIKGTKPAANQCYMTMGKHDQATIDYCLKNGIAYEAYDAMKGCESAASLVWHRQCTAAPLPRLCIAHFRATNAACPCGTQMRSSTSTSTCTSTC